MKRQRCHQEVEVYHRLYKDKINQLTNEALAESPMDTDTDESTSDSDEDSDSDSDRDSDKASRKDGSKSTQELKAYRMKIKRGVLAKAWAGETSEVKEEIHHILEKEKKEKINLDKALICDEKSGLDRSPEQRQM
jgi:hypothetical protein